MGKYISYTFYILLILLITEIVIYFFLKNSFKSLLPGYGYNFKEDNFGLIRDYFEKDNFLGHNIPVNRTKKFIHIPKETAPYEVWGNNIGCNDIDVKNFNDEYIYITGDSFTWGFVNHESKFSTLIRKRLNKFYSIINCGITATGTVHQYYNFINKFEKFENLKYVVVNFYDNDLWEDNDFPAFTVIEGFLSKNDKISIGETRDFAKGAHESNFRDYLRSYSFFFNLIKQLKNKYTIIKNRSNVINLGLKRERHDLPTENEKILKKWKDHSEKNDYELIISMICPKNVVQNYYDKYYTNLKSLGITVLNFCTSKEYKNNGNKLYWVFDGHFNELGHKKYADFLLRSIFD